MGIKNNCPPETIVTERLRLRIPQRSDADAIFQGYAQDPEVVRYLAWRPHQSIEETRRFIEERIVEWNTGSRFSWSITRKEDQHLIGMLSIRRPVPFRISMSYVICKGEWGKGYGTETARTILDWALSLPEVFRVEACCDLDNVGSARVLEKLGMNQEGILRRTGYTPNISDQPRDCFCYAKVK
jgi:ribosomal-protein-alanine N-acetyltransferase